MLTISGFRGVNLVDPARIARTEGLDMMMVVVIFLAIKRLKRPAFVQLAKETQPPVEAARGESGGQE